jgi:hypothetical protein
MESVWDLLRTSTMRGSVIYYQHIREFVTLFLSIVCIVKARTIEAWLTTKIEDDSQQNN